MYTNLNKQRVFFFRERFDVSIVSRRRRRSLRRKSLHFIFRGSYEQIKMAGKIKRQPVIKRGNRGKLGLLGKVHRSKSRTPTKRPTAHDRAQDFQKREQLNAQIAELEREELSNWTGLNALEVKGKKKELKRLRAKMSLKMNKKN